MRVLFPIWLSLLLLGLSAARVEQVRGEERWTEAAPVHAVAAAHPSFEPHAPGKLVPKQPLACAWQSPSFTRRWTRIRQARAGLFRSSRGLKHTHLRLGRRRLPRLRDDKAEPG